MAGRECEKEPSSSRGVPEAANLQSVPGFSLRPAARAPRLRVGRQAPTDVAPVHGSGRAKRSSLELADSARADAATNLRDVDGSL
jgi:hypothetical protein